MLHKVTTELDVMFSIHIHELQQVIEFLLISPFSWGKNVIFYRKCPYVIDIGLHLISWPTAKVIFWRKKKFVVGWANGTKFAVVEMIFKVDMELLNNFWKSPWSVTRNSTSPYDYRQ